jgi:large subunit ribosomal protein L14
MIQQQSILKVSDNSGAKTVKCIKVLGGFKKKRAVIGDTIVVSVQTLRNRSKKTSKVKRKEIYKALLIRTKTKLKKKDGSEIIFKENAVILLSNKGLPVGTRIIGPVPRLFKTKKFQKFLSISSGIV